jgi:RHS repeat-associated protein
MNRCLGLRWAGLALSVLVGALVQAQESPVGRTAGVASVSTTGAARYVMPLALPPGTNGLAPSIAITYDSRSGNGLLGVGFGLSGFSSIRRCASTLAQDGRLASVALDETDRLCLDGQRLSRVTGTYGRSGSTYQTEVEQFTRVTAQGSAGGGPAWFRAESRTGLIYEYGATNDSRIESIGSTTPREWALSAIRDRSGNYVAFSYVEDGANGSYRPSRIDYTGNSSTGATPYYSVRFYYEARPADDAPTAYLGGGVSRELQRLARIEVEYLAINLPLRRYEFAYAPAGSTPRSWLASVRQCSHDDCLPPTVFTAESTDPGLREEVPTGRAVSTAAHAFPGDMDGDGFEDLAYFDASAARWAILRGSAAGLSGAPVVTAFGSVAHYQQAVAIDLDGNGKRDLLVPEPGGYWYWLRHGVGGSYAFSSTGLENTAAAGSAIAADIDGDGLEDLVYARANSHSIAWRRNLTAATGPAFAAEALLWTSPYAADFPTTPFGTSEHRFRSVVRSGDFNGDGRTDLLVWQQHDLCGGDPSCAIWRREWHALTSRGNSLVTSRVFASDFTPQLGDFNGDGLTDVVVPTASGAGVTWLLHYATGSRGPEIAGFTEGVSTAVSAPTNGGALVFDWDADGRADIVYPAVTGGWTQCRATDSTIEACLPTGQPVSVQVRSPIVLDANGDGLADLAYASGDWRFRLHRSGPPGRLARVTDGYGQFAEYSYATLADPTVHVRGSNAAFPSRGLAGSLGVVAKLRQSDGIGGSYDSDFSYSDARLHLQGRGFLGFSSRTSRDSRTGITTTESFSQDAGRFEMLGSMIARETRSANGTLLERTSLEWSYKVFGSGYEQRRFPYVAGRLAEHFELDGQKIISTDERSDYDAFGTLIERTTTRTEHATGLDAGAQHVERLSLTGVVNDAYNWCLGRPAGTRLSRSHSLAGGGEQSRSDSYSWDYNRCRQTQQVVEPSNSKLQVTIAYTYDQYGNVSVRRVTPYGLTTRSTAFVWTQNGRFMGSTVNAEGHRTTYNWDSGRARISSIADPNKLVTFLDYDPFNRIRRVTRPDGTTTVYSRAWCNAQCAAERAVYRVETLERGKGAVYVTSHEQGFDAADRPVYAIEDQPGGMRSVVQTDYDALGRLSRASVPEFCCGTPSRWVRYGYDVRGRLISEERPTSGTIPTPLVTAWRHGGLTTTRIDPLGREVSWTSDIDGNPRQLVDAGGSDTEYEYDAFGNLVTVRDFYGAETRMSYNQRGFRTEINDPDAGRWVQDYYPTGELKSQWNPRGQRTKISYDRLSRPVTRIESDLATTWTWGKSSDSRNLGSLASIYSTGFNESYVYDSLGRLVSANTTISGKTYIGRYYYDSVTGLLDKYSYPAILGQPQFLVRYERDRGRVVRISDARGLEGTFWEARGWNARGRPTQERLGNGVEVSSVYDDVTGLLATRTAGPGGGQSLQNLNYSWDAAGNLQTRRDFVRGLDEQFRYDSRDRLDDVRRNGVLALDLAYDETGNITFKSDVGAYQYDAQRTHAVVAAGSNSYEYDAAGQVSNANGTTIEWTSYALPSQLRHPNGNSASFSYGPDRARFRQLAQSGGQSTETLYFGGGIYERLTRNGVLTERFYIEADGRPVAVRSQTAGSEPEFKYLLSDHLDGVDAVTSSAGSLLLRASYHAFGARRLGSGLGDVPSEAEWQGIDATTARGYTGHEHLDNLGLIHMNGRVYDPVLGRFLSPDPYVQSPYDSQSLNRYSYVANNPLSAVDPSGYAFESIKEIWGDLLRTMIDGMRPGPLGVNFSFANPSGQGVEGSSYTADRQGQDRPFTFGGSPAAGGGAGWNIEAGWHLPHTPAPSSASVELMRQARFDGPRTPAADAGAGHWDRWDAVHIALDGVAASPVPFLSQVAGISSGLWYAIDGAWFDAGLSVAGVLPVVGAVADVARIESALSKGSRSVSRLVDEGNPNLFKWGKDSTSKGEGWSAGDYMFFLPDRRSVKANWAQNAGRLRQQMGLRRPIRDTYRDATTGQQIPTRGFLNAERKLLESRGWQYDPVTGSYHPPKQ